MSSSKHWLFQHDGELRQNSDLSLPYYNTITVRIFVFHEDECLLVKDDKKNRWQVPSFLMNISHSTGSILRQVLIQLAVDHVPEAIINDVQFMDFSQPRPLIKSYKENADGTHELILSVILTTATPARYQILAVVSMQWTTAADLFANIPQLGHVRGLKVQDFDNARERLEGTRKAAIERIFDSEHFYETGQNVLKGILEAKKDGDNIEGGWITLEKTQPLYTIGLVSDMRTSARGGWENPFVEVEGKILRMAGSWLQGVPLSILTNDFPWFSAMDQYGRLNVEFWAD